jgi:hypothetical protein
MGQLRNMAVQAAAEANGNLGRAWEIFVGRFIEVAGEIDLSTDLADLAPRLPVHGSAVDEVLHEHPDDDEKAIKMLAEKMDAREHPTFGDQARKESEDVIVPAMKAIVSHECDDFINRKGSS